MFKFKFKKVPTLETGLKNLIKVEKTRGASSREHLAELRDIYYAGAEQAYRNILDERGNVVPGRALAIRAEVSEFMEVPDDAPNPVPWEPKPGTFSHACQAVLGTLTINWDNDSTNEPVITFYVAGWSFMRVLMGSAGTSISTAKLRALETELRVYSASSPLTRPAKP